MAHARDADRFLPNNRVPAAVRVVPSEKQGLFVAGHCLQRGKASVCFREIELHITGAG
jgi:hypothetical protein